MQVDLEIAKTDCTIPSRLIATCLYVYQHTIYYITYFTAYLCHMIYITLQLMKSKKRIEKKGEKK